jgi:hypothetical protein
MFHGMPNCISTLDFSVHTFHSGILLGSRFVPRLRAAEARALLGPVYHIRKERLVAVDGWLGMLACEGNQRPHDARILRNWPDWGGRRRNWSLG